MGYHMDPTRNRWKLDLVSGEYWDRRGVNGVGDSVMGRYKQIQYFCELCGIKLHPRKNSAHPKYCKPCAHTKKLLFYHQNYLRKKQERINNDTNTNRIQWQTS